MGHLLPSCLTTARFFELEDGMIWLYAVNSDEVSEEVVNELKDSSNDGAGC